MQDQLRSVQQIHSTCYAFAAILADGSVVTWGDPVYGGDSSAVQEQLKGVLQVQSSNWAYDVDLTGGAFAAILHDGSVVT